MEIEYIEESRLRVHSIRVNGKFWGLVVHKDTDNPWQMDHEVHQFTGNGFILLDTVKRSGLIGKVVKEAVEA